MEEQRQPSSPETSTFQLKDTIETLLKFTLTLSIEESLDIGLSKEFCSNLLKDDEDDRTYPSSTSTTDLSEGIPPYPLYKHLALALCKSISNGAIHSINSNIPLIHEDSSMKQKEIEWNKIILEKGSDLIKMLETVEFGLHVQEPYFSQIKDGQKTIEGRCACGDYNRIESGSLVLFNKCLVLQVQDVHYYGSFFDMLSTEDLAKVLPGVETVEEGVQIYRRFYSEEKEKSNGVVGIFLTKPTSQLHDPLAAILKALHYDGVKRLLGISHTVGTIPDALPLPRSALLSAFSTPHNPNVKSSILSDGARALAKHVNRSNGKFWGSFAGNGLWLLDEIGRDKSGQTPRAILSDRDDEGITVIYTNESQKNMAALNVINHLVAHCCWLNVHIVPPHGPVFEIRVHNGYGARWALNPPKFIGFLEPYMEDGHTKGWKH